jgi:hypothetical protein
MPSARHWPAADAFEQEGVSHAKHVSCGGSSRRALSAPIAAQAQGTVGVVGGNAVVIEQDGGIIAEQRPAFREYVVREARADLHDPGSRRGRHRAA